MTTVSHILGSAQRWLSRGGKERKPPRSEDGQGFGSSEQEDLDIIGTGVSHGRQVTAYLDPRTEQLCLQVTAPPENPGHLNCTDTDELLRAVGLCKKHTRGGGNKAGSRRGQSGPLRQVEI